MIGRKMQQSIQFIGTCSSDHPATCQETVGERAPVETTEGYLCLVCLPLER